ncbi:MAG: NAD-dependent epimerase/dehydratase family protein, partial [Alistipes sp.]|nr:NAD-dependent epimerase/dehydratase family protein [Alistipes sp.]
VTGGAGFIGSHLCERLLSDGNEVVAIDNYFTGTRQNIEHLFHNPLFHLVRHDITFPYFEEIDQIYNLACPSAPIYYLHDPVMTLKSSLLGTVNVMELAKRMQARVVHASSAHVYGESPNYPIPESFAGEVNPVGEHSAYEEGKRGAEAICMAYHRQYGIDTRIARLFNIYGPRMALHDGKAISGFIRNALSGENITIRNTGSQTRCFLYIDDAIEALVRMMEREGDLSRPINIGGVDPIQIDALAEDIVNLTGSKSRILHLNLVSTSRQHATPDISYAQRQIAWKPIVPIEEGLIRTIKFFKQSLQQDKRLYPCMSWTELM